MCFPCNSSLSDASNTSDTSKTSGKKSQDGNPQNGTTRDRRGQVQTGRNITRGKGSRGGIGNRGGQRGRGAKRGNGSRATNTMKNTLQKKRPEGEEEVEQEGRVGRKRKPRTVQKKGIQKKTRVAVEEAVPRDGVIGEEDPAEEIPAGEGMSDGEEEKNNSWEEAGEEDEETNVKMTKKPKRRVVEIISSDEEEGEEEEEEEEVECVNENPVDEIVRLCPKEKSARSRKGTKVAAKKVIPWEGSKIRGVNLREMREKRKEKDNCCKMCN